MKLLDINRATLCRWCRKSIIPNIRMPDTSYRFSPDAIQAWIDQRSA
jgi:predicted site-specific integrase-resolvase